MGRARLRGRYVYPGMALAAIGLAAALVIGFLDRPALAQLQQSSAVFLPDGKLKLPTGFRNWVGGPLTPNGLNGEKAIFLNSTTSTWKRVIWMPIRRPEAFRKELSS